MIEGSMRLDLNKIHSPREHHEAVYPADVFSSEGETFRVVAPVSLAVDIVKDREHFQLIGEVASSLELPCSRCLETYTIPVRSAFDLRYQPRTHNAGEGEREIQEDDLSTAFYENEEIDLGQLIREQFYLSLPMKPLCE